MLKMTLAICTLTICGSMNLQAEEQTSLSTHAIEADHQQETLLLQKKQENSSNSTDEAILSKKKQESSSSSGDEALVGCCKSNKCRSKRHA